MTIPLILVGGFLGSGKTTLLLAAAKQLANRGLRVGLVTNDQGDDLVDTAMLRHSQVRVVEVAGGCFCCRYPDMLHALDELRRSVQPDVILAEPVGSCTDLLATVVRPLVQQPAAQYRVAPLTIAYDPLRTTHRFTAEVDYLFQRQIAEAELVVLTKQDLPAASDRQDAAQADVLRYGVERVFLTSAATGAGVDGWLDHVLGSVSAATRRLDIDYTTYAAGEAALGWLNASGSVSSGQAFSPGNWVSYLLQMLDMSLSMRGAEIAHIKAYAQTADATYKASITESRGAVSWDVLPVDAPVTELSFLLNARVQVGPDALASIVRTVIDELSPYPDFTCRFTRFECFRPSAPTPTHRI